MLNQTAQIFLNQSVLKSNSKVELLHIAVSGTVLSEATPSAYPRHHHITPVATDEPRQAGIETRIEDGSPEAYPLSLHSYKLGRCC